MTPKSRKRKSWFETIQAVEPLTQPQHPRKKARTGSPSMPNPQGHHLCECGCGSYVALKTQRQHLNNRGPLWIRHGRSSSEAPNEDGSPWANDKDAEVGSVADIEVAHEGGGSGDLDGGEALDFIDSEIDLEKDEDDSTEGLLTEVGDVPESHLNVLQGLLPNTDAPNRSSEPVNLQSESGSGPDTVEWDDDGGGVNSGLADREDRETGWKDAHYIDQELVQAIWGRDGVQVAEAVDPMTDDDGTDAEGQDYENHDNEDQEDGETVGDSGKESSGIYDLEDAWNADAYKETGILTARDTLDLEFVRRCTRQASNLGPSELKLIRAFNYKVDTLQKDSAYEKTPLAHPELEPWYPLTRLRSFIDDVSGIRPVPWDCCPGSCLAFTGPYSHLQRCTYCSSPRLDARARPLKSYYYIPLTERLASQFRNRERSCLLRYRANYVHTPGIVGDIFDSELYQKLKTQPVEINGKKYNHLHFSDSRDIALGLSFDGFCPFKRRKQTCWPIVLYNYNLPPDIRFHQDNIIPIGTIPGPKQMKDTNSFLLPLIQELQELARGVKVYDIVEDEYFIMHAYLIVAFGDIPAVAKLMNMKGHNALLPCRLCNIRGIRVAHSSAKTHYVPLCREEDSYDPLDLPLRSPEQFELQAKTVSEADTATEQEALAKQTGIKGISVLSCLSSIVLPHASPPDLMHLLYENILPELLDLWTSSYKGFDQGNGDYELSPTVFRAISEAVSHAGNTMPASYGCRVPNPMTERGNFTAESWSIWGMMIAPVVLRNRFQSSKAYVHFVTLIRLMNTALKLEVTHEELDELEDGLAKWVTEFEEIYIQRDMSRIPIATLPIHYLLHLAESIRKSGPLWCCWAFPMERYCGSLLPAINSRKHPFRSIDRREKELEQIRNLKMKFNLHSKLDLSKSQRILRTGTAFEDYPNLVLLPPKMMIQLSTHLKQLIIQHLNQTLSIPVEAVGEATVVETWGKLRYAVDLGGDTIHARQVVNTIGRDMSYIKFRALVDRSRNASRSNALQRLEKQVFYGQLQHIIHFQINNPSTHHQQSHILPLIRICPTKVSTIAGSGGITLVSTGNELRGLTVVDAMDIIGVAARVEDRGHSFFVERPGSLEFLRNTLLAEEVDAD